MTAAPGLAAAVLALGLALGPTAASAQSSKPYVVLGAGVSAVKLDCGGALPCDRSDSGFKLMVGTRGPENLALEGGYWSFGKARVGNAEVGVDGLGLTVALHDDFAPEWTAAGRLGFGSFKSEGGGSHSRKSAMLYGLSIGHRLTPQLAVELFFDTARPKLGGSNARLQLMGVQATMGF